MSNMNIAICKSNAILSFILEPGLDAKMVDPDDGLHSSCLRAQFANQVSPILSVLPLEGWTSSLQQLPPFNYGCLYVHLVRHSTTIAEHCSCYIWSWCNEEQLLVS